MQVKHTSLYKSRILQGLGYKQCKSAAFRIQRGWLPDKTFSLLYNGSTDGMNAAAFHDLCDNKGPTLTVIKCARGNVFGGYASVSWRSSGLPQGKHIYDSDAFLFTLKGPMGHRCVRFPVQCPRFALIGDRKMGPAFSQDLYLWSSPGSSTFDRNSYIGFPLAYSDALKMDVRAFSDSRFFMPEQVEVWAVTEEDGDSKLYMP